MKACGWTEVNVLLTSCKQKHTLLAIEKQGKAASAFCTSLQINKEITTI
jgi:hypothetical protein